MLPERFALLLELYKSNQLDNAGLEELRVAISTHLHDGQLKEDIFKTLREHRASYGWTEALEREIWENIQLNKVAPVRRMQFGWRKMAAAAAVFIVMLGAGDYFWQRLTKQNTLAGPDGPKQKQATDILPGSNRATLTLANGTVIILDSAGNGLLAQQGNTEIIKTADGEIEYGNTGGKPGEVAYNTLATPNGGQQRLTLPDGSLVWLNAASSIHYPTAFTGMERKVAITGEAYFEVTHNPAMPFKVDINHTAEVQVLGTHFNVSAYTDEPAMKTTLLEGSVSVRAMADSLRVKVLKPGDQAQMMPASPARILVQANANIDEAVAWKNGYFLFNDVGIDVIMRQVARWYNLEVVFEGAVPKQLYHGKIARNTVLQDMLKVLAISDVAFRIDGGRIFIK